MIAPLLLCLIASVSDGDTIRCQDGTRLRLAAIDAPELHGCRRGRICAPGNPFASRENLKRLAGRAVGYRIVDANRCRRGFQMTDRYGRSVVVAWNRDGVNLGQAQLRSGFAVPWRCK